MAVAYGTSATTTSTGFVTSIALNMPASISAGDLLIAAVATPASGETIGMTGWTALFTSISGSNFTVRIFWKIAAGSDTATATYVGFHNTSAVVARFTGHDATTPIPQHAESSPTVGGTPTCPTITTTADNCLIVRYLQCNVTSSPTTPPASHTERANANTGGTNSQTAMATRDALLSPAGSAGTASYSNGQFTEWTNTTLAIQPAAAATKGIPLRSRGIPTALLMR